MSLLFMLGPGDDLPRRLADDPPEEGYQEGQETEPPRPLTLEAPERPFKPRYEPGSALRLSVLWLQPRVSYDTREYNPGVFSGDVDLSRRADLPSFAPGLAFSMDLGPIPVDGGFVCIPVRMRERILAAPTSHTQRGFRRMALRGRDELLPVMDAPVPDET